MRRINEKLYEVWEVNGVDAYGQSNAPTYTGNEIECNIAMTNQTFVQDSVLTVLGTYAGLTDYKGLKAGQELRNGNEIYTIIGVNNDARKAQLTLEKR